MSATTELREASAYILPSADVLQFRADELRALADANPQLRDDLRRIESAIRPAAQREQR